MSDCDILSITSCLYLSTNPKRLLPTLAENSPQLIREICEYLVYPWSIKKILEESLYGFNAFEIQKVIVRLCLSKYKSKNFAKKLFNFYQRHAQMDINNAIPSGVENVKNIKARAAAQNMLGHLYRRACGVPQNLQKAFECYLASATSGDAGGQLGLSQLYLFGSGTQKNEQLAIKWCKLSAEQGNIDAQTMMGDIFYGVYKSTSRDGVEASKWYRLSADRGDARAKYRLGSILIGHDSDDNYNFVEGIKQIECSAELGYFSAKTALGEIFYREKRYEEALPFIKFAAERNFPLHMCLLAICNTLGQGMSKNYVEAKKWLKKLGTVEKEEKEEVPDWNYLMDKLKRLPFKMTMDTVDDVDLLEYIVSVTGEHESETILKKSAIRTFNAPRNTEIMFAFLHAGVSPNHLQHVDKDVRELKQLKRLLLTGSGESEIVAFTNILPLPLLFIIGSYLPWFSMLEI